MPNYSIYFAFYLLVSETIFLELILAGLKNQEHHYFAVDFYAVAPVELTIDQLATTSLVMSESHGNPHSVTTTPTDEILFYNSNFVQAAIIAAHRVYGAHNRIHKKIMCF